MPQHMGNVVLYIKGIQWAVLAQIERMVGMPLGGTLSGREPLGAELSAHGNHVSHAAGQIGAFFDDIAPGGPDGWATASGLLQSLAESRHIFSVELWIEGTLHVVGAGGPLGIHVEHDKAVIAIAQGDALN